MTLINWLKTKVQRPAVEKAAQRIIELAAHLVKQYQKHGTSLVERDRLIGADHIDEIRELEQQLSTFTDASQRSLVRTLSRRLDALPTTDPNLVDTHEHVLYKNICKLSFCLAQRHVLDKVLRLPGFERLSELCIRAGVR